MKNDNFMVIILMFLKVTNCASVMYNTHVQCKFERLF